MRDIEEKIRRQFDQLQAWVGLQSPLEQERVRFSASLIPPNVNSVLDAGCGNGAITNAVAQTGEGGRFVVGCDLSLHALRQVQTHRVQCSLRRLPFVNCSFDSVVAFEVIEHVPLEELTIVLRELQRVARRYIILSVPYREKLWRTIVKCRSCGAIYHGYGHYTAWNERVLHSLFAPRYELTRMETLRGNPGAFGNLPGWMYWSQRVIGGYWSDCGHGVCPRCGSIDRVVSGGNVLGWVLTRMIWRLEQLYAKAKPAWIFAVYERCGDQECAC